jgi:hypothetical protein
MTEDVATPPTWRRRIGAALAGLVVYLLVTITAEVLPSALSPWSVPIGMAAGVLVAGGLTPALTIRSWIVAAVSTIAVILACLVVLLVVLFGMWGPDIIG